MKFIKLHRDEKRTDAIYLNASGIEFFVRVKDDKCNTRISMHRYNDYITQSYHYCTETPEEIMEMLSNRN